MKELDSVVIGDVEGADEAIGIQSSKSTDSFDSSSAAKLTEANLLKSSGGGFRFFSGSKSLQSDNNSDSDSGSRARSYKSFFLRKKRPVNIDSDSDISSENGGSSSTESSV